MTEDLLHIHLSEIDPANKPVPQNVYTLSINKAALKDFVYKNGKKAGETGYRAAFTFIITDDPEYSGRRLYDSVFIDSRLALRGLRRLMDATGIEQAPGEPLDEWLVRLAAEQPKVKILVTNEPDVDWQGNARTTKADGVTPQDVNKINWREVQPA